MTKTTAHLLALSISLILLTACNDSDPNAAGTPQKSASGKPVVACVNYPLAYFAERLGGDDIEVYFPEIDGDPAYWAPSDAEIATFQNADLILRNGATYAKWADKVSLPSATQVDTSAAFAGAYIEVEDGSLHVHGDGNAHRHAGFAITTWLDFENAQFQADAVAAALTKLLPKKSAEIAERADALRADLQQRETEMLSAIGKLKNETLITSHPVYQYWAKAYGLKIESVHWEPEIVPDEKAIAELEEMLAKTPSKIMIWEGQPEQESIEKLRTLGIKSIIFDPCGNRPETGDFMSAMEVNIKNLKAAIAP